MSLRVRVRVCEKKSGRQTADRKQKMMGVKKKKRLFCLYSMHRQLDVFSFLLERMMVTDDRWASAHVLFSHSSFLVRVSCSLSLVLYFLSSSASFQLSMAEGDTHIHTHTRITSKYIL